MDETAFWAIIPDSTASKSFDERVVAAAGKLLGLSDDDLLGFESHLRSLQDRAYRWNLWAAGYLAMGGLSDDAFLDFRTWLILHGRTVYEAVLVDPDSLVGLSWDDGEEDFAIAERFAVFPHEIWDERHGTELPTPEVTELDEPTGDRFPEDDDEWFRQHFPRLSAVHLPT